MATILNDAAWPSRLLRPRCQILGLGRWGSCPLFMVSSFTACTAGACFPAWSTAVGLEKAEPYFADRRERGDGVPQPRDGDLGADRDGGRVEQFLDPGADHGDAEQVTVVLVNDHASPAGVVVGVQPCPGDLLTRIDVDHPDAVPGAFSLVGGQADRSGRGIAEEHLRYRVIICRDRMRPPWRGIDRLPGGARGDRGAGDAGLVFTLVGEQGMVVDVAEGIQPLVADGSHRAGVVHFQPRAGFQADGLQADVVGQGPAAGGEQYLVGFCLTAVLNSRATGPVPPVRCIPVTVTPIRTSIPDSVNARPIISPAKGSIRGSRPSGWASRVTEEPRP